MNIGLILVGDEILSGRRIDKHLPKVIELLTARGLCLDWVKIEGDSLDRLEACFRETLASDDLVLSCGGIGGTPDDLTRLAVAKAIGVDTERHPEGRRLLEEFARETGRALTPERYRLIEFPAGADLIPNPYNGIPGFRIEHHHFVPGFPQMAWPMLEWVLDERYPELANQQYVEDSVLILGVNESEIIPIMDAVLTDYDGVRPFSLPILETPARIELGVKGPTSLVADAMRMIKTRLDEMSVRWYRDAAQIPQEDG